MELLKMSKIAQISTCVGLYVHFFMGGKMAVILAVVPHCACLPKLG